MLLYVTPLHRDRGVGISRDYTSQDKGLLYRIRGRCKLIGGSCERYLLNKKVYLRLRNHTNRIKEQLANLPERLAFWELLVRSPLRNIVFGTGKQTRGQVFKRGIGVCVGSVWAFGILLFLEPPHPMVEELYRQRLTPLVKGNSPKKVPRLVYLGVTTNLRDFKP